MATEMKTTPFGMKIMGLCRDALGGKLTAGGFQAAYDKIMQGDKDPDEWWSDWEDDEYMADLALAVENYEPNKAIRDSDDCGYLDDAGMMEAIEACYAKYQTAMQG